MPNIGKPLVNEDGSIGNCNYCQRQMLSRENTYTTLPPLYPTREHVHPQAHGGTAWVWACYQCNSLKGSRTKKAWDEYMRANPRWWEPHVPKAANNKVPVNQPGKPLPYADSMYILKYGKKAYRAAKAEGGPLWPRGRSPIKPLDFSRLYVAPPSVPIAYPDDPKAQAAFAAVYGTRLHLLRSDPAVDGQQSSGHS